MITLFLPSLQIRQERITRLLLNNFRGADNKPDYVPFVFNQSDRDIVMRDVMRLKDRPMCIEVAVMRNCF